MSERTWKILAGVLEDLAILRDRVDKPPRKLVNVMVKDLAKVLDEYQVKMP